METKILEVTQTELPSIALAVLEITKKPFYAVMVKGVMYINKAMPGVQEVTEAIKTMWQYDIGDDAVDRAFDLIAQKAGDQAARQVAEEWSRAAEISRKNKAIANADEWISTVYNAADDDLWDEIAEAGCDSGMVHDGFFSVFCDLERKHADDRRYSDAYHRTRDAILLYGFMLGKNAASLRKGCEKAVTI